MNVVDDLLKDAGDSSINVDVLHVQYEEIKGAVQKEEQSSKAASEILVEFMEVAIHQILYSRKLYPEEIFILRKKYNIPIHIASHPGLKDYISSTLSSVQNLLQKKEICRVSLLVEDGDVPVENFLFEVNILRDIMRKEFEYSELEQSLRSFILKISASGSQMEPLKDTCTFEILVACAADCEADLNVLSNQDDNIKWIKVDKSDFSKQLDPKKILPIKKLTSSPILNMQLIVEQML
uniref:mitotic spindle assembly checkpoint protein MAD2B-like n=1 Tax=Styela clava TaxID=7725 RepID=UPI001939DB0E|nr:mitotic spindle assembly checkpoint protein MAD2B-like [Styela clava]